MRGTLANPLNSKLASGSGRFGVAGLLLAIVTLLAAGDARAASIEVQAPSSSHVLRHSAFSFKFQVHGMSGPYRVVCLVNGRLPDSTFNCDPDRGHADFRNGKHSVRLIAYSTSGPQQVAVKTFGVQVRDRVWPLIQPLVHNLQVVSGDDAPFKFLTRGGNFWRCRVDGRRQFCGPTPGTEYDKWVTVSFQPSSLTPGWHRLSFGSMDANHRWGIADRLVYVAPGAGPRIDVLSPGTGTTTDDSPVMVKFWISQAHARVQCRVDGVRVRNCTGDDRTYRFGPNQTAPLPLSNGPHSVTLRAIDTVGNYATTVTNFTVNDSTAPSVAFEEPQDGRVYTDIADWRLIVHHSPGVLECRLRPVDFAPCGAYSPTGAAWPDSATWGGTHPQANGDYIQDVRVTDPEGRTTTATSSFTIADTTPPNAYPVWPLMDQAPRVFAMLFSDYGERWRCTISIDGAAFKLCNQGRPRFEPDLMLQACGPHTYTVQLRDGVGNMQTITRNINVVSGAGSCPHVSPPTAPVGDPGPTGTSGPSGTSGPTDVTTTLIRLNRPVIRFKKHGRAAIRLSGSLSGDCTGSTRVSVRLRGKRKIGGSPQLRTAGTRCSFTVTRKVAAWRIAGLNTKVVAEFKNSGGKTRVSRDFRAPTH